MFLEARLDLDELYRLLRGSHVQAIGIVNTLRDPLLVLDGDLTIISANPAFYRTFQTSGDDTIGVPFPDLGNGQWNIPELRGLLDDVIPKSAAIIDHEVRADFPRVGLRTMLVSAQRLQHPEHGRRILLLSIVDATERRRVEEEKDILIGELDHRIKNLMAVTRALAAHTAVSGRSAMATVSVGLRCMVAGRAAAGLPMTGGGAVSVMMRLFGQWPEGDPWRGRTGPPSR